MIFRSEISIGDISVIVIGLLSLAGYFFGIKYRLDALSTTVEDVRRGRGLILGPNSDWPAAVRRCFGMTIPHERE